MEEDLESVDYDILICVAGSRSFHDPELFALFLRIFLSWIEKKQLSYAFISGGAPRGADRMIIDWAKENDKPCFVRKADWNKYGKGAGFRRNAEMRKELTHLLAFYDGESKGTLEMIEKTNQLERDVHISVIIVEPDKDWAEYCKWRDRFQHH